MKKEFSSTATRNASRTLPKCAVASTACQLTTTLTTQGFMGVCHIANGEPQHDNFEMETNEVPSDSRRGNGVLNDSQICRDQLDHSLCLSCGHVKRSLSRGSGYEAIGLQQLLSH